MTDLLDLDIGVSEYDDELIRQKKWSLSRKLFGLRLNRAMNDTRWFLENCWRIKTQKVGDRGRFHREVLQLRPWQKEFIQLWDSDMMNLMLLKSRRIGVTMLMTGVFDQYAMANPESELMYVTYLKQDVTKFTEAIRTGHKELPEWLLQHPKTPRIVNKSTSRIEYSNGSVIMTAAAKGDPARGHGLSVLYLDEYPRHPDPQQSLRSAIPATERGKLLIAGTAWSPNDFFHTRWNDAVENAGGYYPDIDRMAWEQDSGGETFFPIFYGWRAVLERDDNWYKAKLKSEGRQAMAREYPDTPDDAFAHAGALAFEMDFMDRQIIDDNFEVGHLESPARGGVAHELDVDTPEFFPDEDLGSLKVWIPPEQGPGGDQITVGVDIAEGVEGGDWSVATAITWDGEVMASLRMKCGALEFADELMLMSAWYGWPMTIIERDGFGMSVIGALYAKKHRGLWRQNDITSVATNNVLHSIGFNMTSKSKKMLVAQIADTLRTGWLTLNDKSTLTEMKSFVQTGRGTYGGQPHDDRVIAIGLAIHANSDLGSPTSRYDASLEENTVGWWKQIAALMNNGNPIGANLETARLAKISRQTRVKLVGSEMAPSTDGRPFRVVGVE